MIKFITLEMIGAGRVEINTAKINALQELPQRTAVLTDSGEVINVREGIDEILRRIRE